MGQFDNDTFIEEGGEGPEGMPGFPDIRVLIGIQVILMIVGSSGNIITLYIYGRRGERFTYIIAIMFMALKDLLYCVIVIPYRIVMEAIMFRMSSDFFCKLFHYTMNVELPLSVYIFTILALERSACVCHSHIHIARSKEAFTVAVIVTLFSCGQAIVPALGFGVDTNIRVYGSSLNISMDSVNQSLLVNFGVCHFNENVISFDTIDAYHNFVIFLFGALAVVMLLLYVSTFVVVVYRKNCLGSFKLESRLTRVYPSVTESETSENPDKDSFGHGGADSNVTNDEDDFCHGEADPNVTNDERTLLETQQRWLAVIFFIAAVAFWLTLIPSYLMALGIIRGGILIFLIFRMHCVINPIIYFSLDANFRKEVLELFRSRWSRLVHK